MKKKLIAAVLLALVAAGCSLRMPPPKNIMTSEREDRFGTLYIATEINRNLQRRDIMAAPVIVTTFVDLNDLGKTSVFGRMMAERLIDELNKQGFRVLEVRRAQDLFMKKDVGEMILTRDVAELGGTSNARSVLAGTYVATEQSVIINARLIDTKSPQVISTVSFEVVMTREIEGLLQGTSPF